MPMRTRRQWAELAESLAPPRRLKPIKKNKTKMVVKKRLGIVNPFPPQAKPQAEEDVYMQESDSLKHKK